MLILYVIGTALALYAFRAPIMMLWGVLQRMRLLSRKLGLARIQGNHPVPTTNVAAPTTVRNPNAAPGASPHLGPGSEFPQHRALPVAVAVSHVEDDARDGGSTSGVSCENDEAVSDKPLTRVCVARAVFLSGNTQIHVSVSSRNDRMALNTPLLRTDFCTPDARVAGIEDGSLLVSFSRKIMTYTRNG